LPAVATTYADFWGPEDGPVPGPQAHGGPPPGPGARENRSTPQSCDRHFSQPSPASIKLARVRIEPSSAAGILAGCAGAAGGDFKMLLERPD